MLANLSLALETGPTFIYINSDSKKNILSFNSKKAQFVVAITAKAENRVANEAIEQFLSKELGQAVKITRGKTSLKKYIKLSQKE